ncbi:MAG TPA: 30S ribosomal protein S1 [Armatimonadota bacterium]|nr:30S ribosomal protein S1 [Armatimonadota bacterium]
MTEVVQEQQAEGAVPAPAATGSNQEQRADVEHGNGIIARPPFRPLEINWDDPYAFKALKEGDIIQGAVVHIDREGILVDVGMKSEGLIPPDHISSRGGSAAERNIHVGDIVDVYVLDSENQEGNLILSKKKADYEKSWQRIMDAHKNDDIINAVVTDRVKGGLVVDVGIRGFVPASHVGSGKVRNLERYIGQTIPLKAIEVDRERKRVVLSNKAAEEEERNKRKAETLATLEEGQVRQGIVRRVTDYGAFVDIGGIDGLLHVSEMSWTRIKHPNDVVHVGDEIQVMVLKVSEDRKKISLGLRQILPDPWSDVGEQFREGQIVTGVVTRLVPFGAFVQLKEGVEGIIPNTELSDRRVSKPDEILSEGEEVTVKILDVRPEERRINLSLRQVSQDGQAAETTRYIETQRETRRSTIGDMVDFAELEGKRSKGRRPKPLRAQAPEEEEEEEEYDELDENEEATEGEEEEV